MQIKANKKNHRLLATSGLPPESLKPVCAVRVLGKERKMGQYKIINGSTKRFNNFKELRYFNNQVVAGKPKYIVIKRDDKS